MRILKRYISYKICNGDVLFRWRIVIHGCIDGYSRRIMYLRASDNNSADTVLELFVDAVQQFGFQACKGRQRR